MGRGRRRRRRQTPGLRAVIGESRTTPLVWFRSMRFRAMRKARFMARSTPSAVRGAVKRLGQKAPATKADGAERGHPRSAEGHRPPGRAAPGRLVRGEAVEDGNADAVGDHRPDVARGPAVEADRPARPRRGRDQVDGAPPAIARGRPGGDAGHEGREDVEQVARDHGAARSPEGSRGQRVAITEQHKEPDHERQQPDHLVAAQLEAQKTAGGDDRRPATGRGRATRLLDGGAHERASASTAL